MTSDQPRINQSGFVTIQQNKVLAIVPDGHLDEAIAALADAGVDLKEVDVLQGETGARILDFDGTEHGLWAHVARTMQKLGSASNERENYATALRDGEAVVIVAVLSATPVDLCTRVLSERGCRRIIHFGKFTRDQLSY
jgi:hypothetical protein